MDPCGTPYFTGSRLEMLFPIHKLCVRSDKYDYLKFADSFVNSPSQTIFVSRYLPQYKREEIFYVRVNM